MDTQRPTLPSFSTLILLGLAITLGYTYYESHNVCDFPIRYSISSVDPRFNLTQQEVKNAVEEATLIWEKPLGIDLFEYDPKGKVHVTFVYDERQAQTEKRKMLEENTEALKDKADDVKAKYGSLKNKYEVEQNAYEALILEYKNEEAKYNQTVEYWNSRGGAPGEVYNDLQQQKNSLATKYNEIEERRSMVNSRVADINAFMSQYNGIVEQVNNTIDTINEGAGREFQEGTYNPKTKTITIYEFSNKTKLLRVLAHELGHALSLDHNSNPKSIMYELNEGDTLTPTKDDIDSLKSLCKL